ncbi:hypothetical protein HPP92_019463 [Vanilla planifolia]|nr:hypothetical protein HPP92_019463 [Vanilla planifolia]
MTESCNLEMIHNGNKIWELHAARESTADCLLYMQLRGVLALYAKTMNRLLWESNQAKGWTGGLGFRNYIFVLRPDGVATVLGNATLLDDNTLSGVTVWSTAA